VRLQEIILEETDLCVLCGMCAPHCPTYRYAENENESPRGRIVSLQALARGDISDPQQLRTHLDHCVRCRACEAVCPSKVHFQKIITRGITLLEQQNASNDSAVNTDELPQQLNYARALQRPLLRRVIDKISQHSDNEKSRHWRMLPTLPTTQALEKYYQTPHQAKGRVALLTGCISKTVENQTLHNTVMLLLQAGFDVDIPQQQGCCGALDLHQGNITEARQLATNNLDAFATHDYDAIITIASGCGAMLKGYTDIDAATPPDWSEGIVDISHFLVQHLDSLTQQLQPLNKCIVIHTPCSLEYPMKQAEGCRQMLASIPDIKLHNLNLLPRCCGAGGSHMLNDPQHADALLQPTLDAIEQLDADILVTSNLGCAMHIRQGLKARGRDIQVQHPVDLMAAQFALAKPDTQG